LVSAKDTETGLEQSIQVTASSGLTQDEISKMMESAQDYMVERKVSDELEGAKQNAEKAIAEIEKLFPQVEAVVASSDFGREALAKARDVIHKTKDAIERRDAAQLKEHAEALNRTLKMFKGVASRPS